MLPDSFISGMVAYMKLPEHWVRDYYDDVELHAHIAINLMGNDNLSLHIMDGEIEYRAQLLGEKFLQDPDTVETDLRRCIWKIKNRVQNGTS